MLVGRFYLQAYDHCTNAWLGSTTLLNQLSTSSTIQSMGLNPRGGLGF